MCVLFLDGNYASMSNFADGMLELDGGVVNVKVVVQAFLDIAKDALTGRGWEVRD